MTEDASQTTLETSTMPDALKPALKCQEAVARAVAKTKGVESTAARALAEFVKRREAGEGVVMFPLRGKWLVAPASEVQTESDRVGELSRARTTIARLEFEARESRSRLAAQRAHKPAR